jgi:hypothetical protein
MKVRLFSGQDYKKVIIVTANELLARRNHEDHKEYWTVYSYKDSEMYTHNLPTSIDPTKAVLADEGDHFAFK